MNRHGGRYLRIEDSRTNRCAKLPILARQAKGTIKRVTLTLTRGRQ
ncbi:hypothetical protein [Zoogloea sp.]|jgi:hypothetical protein